MKFLYRSGLIILVGWGLISCSQADVQEVLKPSGTSTPIIAPDTAAPTTVDNQWQSLEPGLELREISYDITNVQVLRIDPAYFRLRVGYDVASPGRVSEWAAALKSVAVINGGYFDPQGRATALTIFDGVVNGTSYDGFGGMLAVDSADTWSLRSLREQPYDSNEVLNQALQSAPMLVVHGAAIEQPNDDGDKARRSVIALDRRGRLLIIVCSWPSFTLTELSQWLVKQDLAIDAALNLDGGSSTGLVVSSESRAFKLDSLVRVPQVLLVERR